MPVTEAITEAVNEDGTEDVTLAELGREAEALNRQLEIELRMVENGRDAFWRSVESARERGEESGTGYGQSLLRALIEPMTKAVIEFVEESDTGAAGRRNTAVRYLRAIEPEILSYLALKAALDSVTKQERFSRIALRIGTAVADELRMRALKKDHPEQFRFVKRKLDREHHQGRMRTLARYYANKVELNFDWDTRTKILVGTKLLDLLITSTGLVEVQRVYQSKSHQDVFVVPTSAAMKWVDRATERMEILNPAFVPTIIPPKPWTSPLGGGYWSSFVHPLPIVKTRNKNYLEELGWRHMEPVYAAVNAIQNTPWRINDKVLAVAMQAWDMGVQRPKLKIPPREQEDMPPKPVDIAENEESRREWRKKAARVYERNVRVKSRRMQFRKIIQLAQEFGEHPAIYFPHQLDFRGRAYCVPMFLNPQGPDIAKGLLTFSDGKPIMDGVAAGWLAVHGSNSYGFDKAPLEERIGWVEDRNSLILSTAADPFGEAFEFWTKADSPWQFLAFCYDWAGLLAEGYGYVSSLPIAMDGSCNGLQHYSAALRDPVGGAAVNLTPSDEPEDIYARVADVVKRYLKAFLRLDQPDCGINPPEGVVTLPFSVEKIQKTWEKHGIDAHDLAHKWEAYGVSRSITKRSVMTLPYGSTQFSCREFVEEVIREEIEEGKANPFATAESDGLFKASLFLQPFVWHAIGEVVKAARVGMDWLKECAKLAADEGVPVTWELPDGLLVMQSYYNTTVSRIATTLSGEIRVRMNILEETDSVDRRRQQQGIAPNWVHSMDACAMRMYVNMATSHGIKHFALVHDSYGTVAADVELMGRCLRQAFIDLYTQNDPLETFRVDMLMMLSEDNAKLLPAVPEKGTLDLSKVADSDFFFA